MILLKYLAYDVEHIKRYIFSSKFLKTVVGGSIAVREFDREVKRTLEEEGLEVIYASGGAGLARFIDGKVDADLVVDIIKKKAEHYGLDVAVMVGDVDSLKFSPVEFFDSADDMGEVGRLFAKAGFLLNKEKQSLRKSSERTIEGSKICEVCGEREADGGVIQAGDEQARCCRICKLKDELARKNGKENVYDVTEIASSAGRDETYMAVLYGDGNSLGTLFEKCKDIEEYRQLSKKIENMVEEGTKRALEESCVKRYARPVLGGDDVLLFLPPRSCLEVLKRLHKMFCEAFEEQSIDFCFSLMVIPSNLPILIAFDMATELLKRAKLERSNQGSGYFVAFKYVDRIEQGEAFEAKRAVSMSEFFNLLDLSKELMNAGFGKGHLHKIDSVLKESLSRDEMEIHATYFVLRALQGDERFKLAKRFLNEVIAKDLFHLFADVVAFLDDFQPRW